MGKKKAGIEAWCGNERGRNRDCHCMGKKGVVIETACRKKRVEI